MRRRVAGFFRGPKVGNIAPIRLTKPARAGDGAEPPAPGPDITARRTRRV